MAEESQEIKKGFSSFLERFSADNAEKREVDKKSLDGQKQELSQLKTTIESQGGVAEKNAEYNKADLAVKLKDLALQKRSATNKGAQEEIEKERQAAVAKQGTLLQRIAGGISGIFGNMKEGVKAAGKGFMSILKGTLMAGLFIAIATFLQSPLFGQIIDYITNTLIPKLMFFYDAFFGPNGGFINGIMALFSDDSGIGAIVLGLAAVGIIFAGFKIFKAFTAIKTGVIATKAFLLTTGGKLNGMFGPKGRLMGGIGKAFKLLGVAGGLIVKGFLVVKTFLTATLLPAITAFMVPLLPIIAIIAAVVAVGYAIYEGFKAFQKRFEETGSIFESIKAAFSTFVGTILGLIPMLIQKLIVFVAELFGFDEFAAKLGSFDVIGEISTAIEKVIDYVIDFFVGLPDKISAFFTKYIGPDAEWAKNIQESITDFFAPIINFDFSALLGDLLKKAGDIGKRVASFFGFGGDKKEDVKSTQTKSTTDVLVSFEKERQTLQNRIDQLEARATRGFRSSSAKRSTEGELSLREKQLNQLNKSAIAKSMGGDASTPTIVNAPTIKSSTNTSNSTTSSTSYIGNPDQTITMSAGSY